MERDIIRYTGRPLESYLDIIGFKTSTNNPENYLIVMSALTAGNITMWLLPGPGPRFGLGRTSFLVAISPVSSGPSETRGMPTIDNNN